jgi:hypothetical protein
MAIAGLVARSGPGRFGRERCSGMWRPADRRAPGLAPSGQRGRRSAGKPAYLQGDHHRPAARRKIKKPPPVSPRRLTGELTAQVTMLSEVITDLAAGDRGLPGDPVQR